MRYLPSVASRKKPVWSTSVPLSEYLPMKPISTASVVVFESARCINGSVVVNVSVLRVVVVP